jgi:hypothetical protein
MASLRVKQCKTCPWRIGSTVDAIPNYARELHEKLTCTIAKPGDTSNIYGPTRIMGCHYSTDERQIACAGWLNHQLGVGNSIGVRLRVIQGSLPAPEVDGPQHERFEDTFCGDET